MDRISSEKRSWNMGQIKSTDTKPEKIVRSFIHNTGLRFRLHDKNLPGRPDIILKKYNTVIFVDGCFWHRHIGCKYCYTPKSRKNFWEDKFKKNIERDKVVNKSYNSIHWRLIRIWECEIDEKRLHNLVNQIKNSYF